MTIYRNIRCNVTTPKTKLDHTAWVILDQVSATPGVEVPASQIRAAIKADPMADIRLKSPAIKALRNVGYAITTVKARHMSTHKLAATPSEYEDHRCAVVLAAFSAQVTVCRELAGAVASMPQDLVLDASYKHSQMAAISLGTDVAVGMSIPQVLAELAPLP